MNKAQEFIKDKVKNWKEKRFGSGGELIVHFDEVEKWLDEYATEVKNLAQPDVSGQFSFAATAELRDACPHKKGSVIEIFETNNLPTITGDNTKYYDGFCVDCEKMVYGRTGKKVIRWTTDRNYAFGD